MCDFSEACLLPLDIDMETADENGFTMRIGIGLLGAVIYEVVTGNKCEVDLFKENAPSDGRAYWPKREFLPSTQDIWLGWIKEGCWNGEFRDAQNLLRALDSVDLQPESRTTPLHILVSIKKRLGELSVMAVVGAFGVGVLTLFIGRRYF